MRKIVLLALLLIGACRLEMWPQEKAMSKDLRDFRNEVCPAAINGLRAVTEKELTNPENFKDTTVLMDLREATAMFEMVLEECGLKISPPTPDTTSNTAPDSASEESKNVSNIRVALAFSSAPPTTR